MQATTTRILTHMDSAWSWADGRCNARAHSVHGGHPRMSIRAHRPDIMGVHIRPRSSAKWASTQHTWAPMIRLLWLHDIGRNGHPRNRRYGPTQTSYVGVMGTHTKSLVEPHTFNMDAHKHVVDSHV